MDAEGKILKHRLNSGLRRFVYAVGLGICLVAVFSTIFTARAQETYTLTVLSDHGLVTKEPDQEAYVSGTAVLLTMGAVDPGWTFTGWEGGGCSGTAPCTVIMNANITVTANFSQDHYSLTVSSAHGPVTKEPDQATYTYGTEVLLTMGTVDPGWTFTGWSGGGCSGTAPCTVTMLANTTVTANFSQDHYSLTVSSAHGPVTKEPDQATYTYGTEVLLTMGTVDPGWTFTGWSGGGCSGTAPCTVTMVANSTVTANFSQDEYLLDVSASPAEGGSVLVSPAGPYHLNDLVTLTPQAAIYWTFQDWGGRNSHDLIDNHNGTWGLVMDEDKTVKANFTPISINIQDAVVQEGDTGTVAMTFNLTLLTPASELTTVNYHTSDGSAVAGSDYETASGTVVFQPGDQSETITVQVTGDLLDEEDETFDVILSDLGGVIPLDETGVGTILDNDDQPNLTIVPSIDLFEGNSGVVNAMFTITLSTASGKTVMAHYETVDGAAKGGNPIVQGIDYLSMNDQVVFAPGEVMKRIWVPLNPDDICEAYETFYLDLSEVENAQLLLNRSQATIKNEDPCFVFLPIIHYRKMIFSDYFNSEAGWEEVPEFKSDWFILIGEYHGKHVIPDRNAKAIAPVTSAQLNGSYSVEATVRSEIGSGNDGRGGLLFDYLGNNATYRFVIIPRATSGNNWFVQVRNTDLSQWDTLGSGLDLVNIRTGNGMNVLRIERTGSQIRAYVNDYLLWEGNDSTFMMGRVGLNIGTPVDLAPDKYIEFAFDNFLIGSLP